MVPAGVEYFMAQFAANTAALRAELNTLETDLAEQSKVYTQKHPKIVSLISKIQALRRKLTDEVERAARGLRNEYEIAVKTEKSLESQIRGEEQSLKSLNAKGLEHAVLKREVESNVRIYELLAAREKETGVLSGIRTNNIRLVDRAKVPRFPFSPNRPRALALGLLLGVFGGLGLAFFLEYLDDSVSDPDQLERYVNVPFLGPVPLLEPKETGPLSRDLIAMNEPKSVYAEAYRTVRTSILFSSPDNPPRVFAITSSGQQEGKSLTAINLAVTMALNDKRVLLIDADMRKPRLHKVFGLENKFGLSNLIGGSPDVGLALHKTTVPTLMVMPSGPVPPNPSELLGSVRLGKFLELLREKFDVIILDCTPLIAVTDATVLSTQVDGVILVIKSGATRRKILQRGVKQLQDVQATIIGAVLNQVNVRNSTYYYASYYSHYYGEKEDKGKGARKQGADTPGPRRWWRKRSA
ncbi:MAG: polysaccharide biosynthesis tyrosine autokinase [Candidatus Methylomirabilia bacterium]